MQINIRSNDNKSKCQTQTFNTRVSLNYYQVCYLFHSYVYTLYSFFGIVALMFVSDKEDVEAPKYEYVNQDCADKKEIRRSHDVSTVDVSKKEEINILETGKHNAMIQKNDSKPKPSESANTTYYDSDDSVDSYILCR